MAIDRAEVERIALLARLEMPEARVARTAEQLSAVLDFIAALRDLDPAGCEPTVFAPREAPLRDDALDDERRLTPEAAVAAAPEAEDHFFLVPPIVENVAP